MTRQIWGFNLSFLFHATTILIFVAIGRFIEMEQKPVVMDFSITKGSQGSGGGSRQLPKAAEKQSEVVRARPVQAPPPPPLSEARDQVQEESPVAVPAEEKPVRDSETFTELASPGSNLQAQVAATAHEGETGGLRGYGTGEGAGGTVRGGTAATADTEFGSSEAPRFRYREIPAYPMMARKLGKEARVVLRLTIDEYGKLLNVEVLQRAEYGFTEAAVNAVRGSTFFPAIQNGTPVMSRAILPVGFVLR